MTSVNIKLKCTQVTDHPLAYKHNSPIIMTSMAPAMISSVFMSPSLAHSCSGTVCHSLVAVITMSSCTWSSPSPSSPVMKHLRTVVSWSQRQVMAGLYGWHRDSMALWG